MMIGQQPIIILKEGTTQEKGKGARSNNILAAVAISDAVKSTLGPKGMDKMLVDSMGDVVITNDGATLLKEIDIEHPAAKMIIEVAKSQDEECGDGTTTAVIFTGELLKSAGELLEQNIHPTIISSGYKLAADKAVEILKKISIQIDADDKVSLKRIAKTAIASKGASVYKDILSEIVVDAVTSIAEVINSNTIVDLDNIKIQKQYGGSIDESEIVKGIIIDKERVYEGMPNQVKKAKIALINSALEVKKTEVNAKIEIRSPSQLQAFLDEEENMLRRMVDKIRKSGASVLISQKGIDDIAEHFLTRSSIYAVKNVKEIDLEKLAKACGAKIITNLDDLSSSDIGYAGIVEEKKFGDNKLTFIMDCKNPKAVSIFLRGGTEHVVDELERGLHDSLSVLKAVLEDGKVTVGGGAAATEIAMVLRDYAPSVGGREQMAIEAFANSIEIVPKTLSQNAGLDPIDIMIEIRRHHKSGNKNFGVNVLTGKVEDMLKNNIVEPLRIGIQEIIASSETAVMILRIDDVISAKGGGSQSKSSSPHGIGDGDDLNE